MSIQSDLDVIYEKQEAAFESAHLKREAIEAPIRKRKAILEAINNYPSDWRPRSLFEAILSAVPKARVRINLRLVERVIVKRLT